MQIGYFLKFAARLKSIMAEQDLENTRNNKQEAKYVLRQSIISLLISVLGIILFVFSLNRIKLGENAGVTVSQISTIVLCFCVIVYAGFLATRNLLLSIRELIISKDKFNFYSIGICISTLIGIITLIAVKVMSIA